MKAYLIFKLIFFLIPEVFGLSDSAKFAKTVIPDIWTDSRDLVTAPVRWDGKDWMKLVAIGGTTAALTAVDRPVQEFFQKHQTPLLSDVSAYALEPFGNIYSFTTMAGFLAHGFIARSDRSISTGLLALESYLISGLIVRVPKLFAGRVRPDAWWGPTPGEWRGPGKGKSFPSGHTTSAFAVASVIAFRYSGHKWVPVTAYTLAALTGVSRMYDNRHWLSDVFAGAVIGTVTGRFICRQKRNNQLSLQPARIGGLSGLQLVYHW
jgi:membrane-associated phospholipid phosphatase